jgi:hypothetical protein
VFTTSVLVRSASVVDDPGTPAGINVGIGTVVVVGAAVVAAMIPAADAGWRFGAVAAAVGLFAAVSLDQRALGPVVGLGWLVVNGFLINRLGELSWHGSVDVLRLMLLVVAGTAGLALGEVAMSARERRERWRLG